MKLRICMSDVTAHSNTVGYNQCFQDVRLIATNRPGRLELLDQGLRLGQIVQEIGRPISRRPVTINRPSRLCGRPAREWAASQSWAYLVVLYFGPSPLGFLFFATRAAANVQKIYTRNKKRPRRTSAAPDISGGEEDDSDHDAQEDQHASDPVVPMEEDEDTRGDGGGFRVDADLLE